MMTKMIKSIYAEAEAVKEPRNYFSGVNSDYSQCNPNNIIMLYRWFNHKMKLLRPGLYHQRYVLTLNLTTDGMACINERTIEFKQGSALLIYPFQFHNYMVDTDTFRWLVITFESGGIVPVDLMNRTVKISNIGYVLAEQMLRSYRDAYENDNASAGVKLKTYLDCLLLELIDCARNNPLEKDIPLKDRKAELIERINGYIYANFSKVDLSLDEIAAAHGISKGYLCTLFKKMIGRGPGEHIRSVRINRALNLLKSGNYLISEVAELSGYSSPAIFSRSFHREMGISPREYLQSHRHR